MKFLAFGIDGLSYDAIKQAIASGVTPNIANLSAKTPILKTRCTWPPHTASGWTSLFSGLLPGEHGHFQFWNCQSEDMSLQVTQRKDANVKMLWDIFHDVGWKVGLMNVPMTHPADGRFEFEFTWPLHHTLRYTHPPGLLGRIKEADGLILSDLATMCTGETNYWKKAISYIKKRTRGTLAIIRENPVDALFIVYSELDRVLHHFWGQSSASNADEANASEPPAASVVLQAIDAALGEYLPLLADDGVILIASDHGFGPAKGYNLIEDTLEQYRFLTANNAGQIIPEKSHAFMSAPGSFGINFNLVGRQSFGIVDYSEIDSLSSEISDLCLSMKSKRGEPVFKAVVPKSLCYNSHPLAPDLLLVPHDPGLTVGKGLSRGIARPLIIDGQHRLSGMALVSGLGQSDILKKHDLAIEDVLPSILKGLELGSEIPGRVLHRGTMNEAPFNTLPKYGLPIDSWVDDLPTQYRFQPIEYEKLNMWAEATYHESRADAEERLKAMGYL